MVMFRLKRRGEFVEFQHGFEIADAASRQRADGASAQGVDADALGAQIVCQIFDRAFQGCLRNAHDIIVGHDPL